MSIENEIFFFSQPFVDTTGLRRYSSSNVCSQLSNTFPNQWRCFSSITWPHCTSFVRRHLGHIEKHNASEGRWEWYCWQRDARVSTNGEVGSLTSICNWAASSYYVRVRKSVPIEDASTTRYTSCANGSYWRWLRFILDICGNRWKYQPIKISDIWFISRFKG